MATVVERPVEAPVATQPTTDRLTIIAYSGELEAVWATLIMASAGAATGMETTIFFTFWGLFPLVREEKRITGGSGMQKMLSMMHHGGLHHLKTSKLNFAGAGPTMMRKLAKRHHMASPEELLALCRELDVKLVPCEASMDMMGIRPEDLVDGVEAPAGAASMLAQAQGGITLFV